MPDAVVTTQRPGPVAHDGDLLRLDAQFNLLGGAQEIESSGLFGREAAEFNLLGGAQEIE